MQQIVVAFLAFLPRLLGAAVVLVLGLILAAIARVVVAFVLRRLQFDELCRRAGITQLLDQGRVRRRPSQLVGAVVFYAVVLYTLVTAAGALGLTFLAGTLSQVILYAPRALTAAVLLLVGVVVSGFVAAAAERVFVDLGLSQAGGLRTTIRFGLIFLFAILAAALLGIDVALLIAVTIIVLSGVALTAALAIGLGLRGLSENIAASRYLAEGIAEGDRIVVNGTRGTVEKLGHAMTTLRGDDGRVFLVPNQHFLQYVVEKEAAGAEG